MPSLEHLWLVPSAIIWLFLWRAERSCTLVMILLRLPSTFLHEVFGHWLVAFCLGCSPSFPSLWPRHDGDGWTLGSVTARVTWFTAFPVGMAPLLLPPGFWLLHRYSHIPLVTQAVILPFVVQACTPSRQDFRVAFSTIGGSLFWIGVMAVSLIILVPGHLMYPFP